ncbi:type II secretion system minor pseudopilin GspK [Thermodesulfobacteriota bacterium]
MEKVLKDDRGVALILTIAIISIIVTLTLHFNAAMRSEFYAAANLRDEIRLGYIARSGFNCALAVIYKDAQETSHDSVHETWAHSKKFSSYSGSLFDEGRFEVLITDLTGKIPINQLFTKNGDQEEKILVRLLTSEYFNIEPEEAEDIVDSIKDWIDGDNEITEFGGAEDSYYMALAPPYRCRNAPLTSLEELLLVKGITKELFYGSLEKPGISNHLTVHGNGAININTADPLVLRSLSADIDPETVEEIVAYREDEENDLSNYSWYKTALGTNEDIISPDLITTRSSYFEIKSKGIKDNMIKEIKGVVERDNDKVLRIMSWGIL